jgi:dephospho-CoA kinase
MTVNAEGSRARGGHGNRPLVIGLTGPIAAGKSTVADLLRERGATVIDADQVYRSLLNSSSDVAEKIVARFGPVVLGPDRQIDRAALGKIVFGDPAALAVLERITHPPVVAEVRRQIAAATTEVVVVEAVKLVESGLLADVDRLWLVTADPEVRVRRLAAYRGLSEDEARARLTASSHVAEPKASVDVDLVIQNSGDMSCVAHAVAGAWLAVVAPLVAADCRQPELVVSSETKELS